MICTIVLPHPVGLAYWDALLHHVHACTPLIAVPRTGVLHAGTDNLSALRTLVERHALRASLAPCRRSGYLTACASVARRMDAHLNDDDVSVDVLPELPEARVPPTMVRRMHMFGLHTIGHLLKLTPQHLQAQFGTTELPALLSLPNAPLPLYTPPPCCQTSVYLNDGTTEPEILQQMLSPMAQRVVAMLNGRVCYRVELSALNNARTVVATTHRILRTALRTARELMVHTTAMLRAMMRTIPVWHGIDVRLACLAMPTAEQLSLLPTRATAGEVYAALAPRYGATLRRVEVLNPWSVDADRFARLVPYSAPTP